MTILKGEPQDWRAIRTQFERIRLTLAPYHVCTADDLRRYRLSVLTYGRIESQFERRIQAGDWVYSRDPERLALLEVVACELNFPNAHRPAAWPEFFPGPRPIDWAMLDDAIERENAPPSFVLEWGRLHEIAAHYLQLVHLSKRYADEVGQGLAGELSSSNLVKEYWYAHWVQANSRSLVPGVRRSSETVRQGR